MWSLVEFGSLNVDKVLGTGHLLQMIPGASEYVERSGVLRKQGKGLGKQSIQWHLGLTLHRDQVKSDRCCGHGWRVVSGTLESLAQLPGSGLQEKLLECLSTPRQRCYAGFLG